jgi:hypothetical protein
VDHFQAVDRCFRLFMRTPGPRWSLCASLLPRLPFRVLVAKQQTARDLRQANAQAFDGCPWKENAIRHLEVVPITQAEFQAARAALADRI